MGRYNTRSEYGDVGIIDDYKSKMKEVIELHNAIYEKMPLQAQYVVTFGFNIRWYYRMNAREITHIFELRTPPGGHPDYRTLLQDTFKNEVRRVHPDVAKHMKFIDLTETTLGRLTSEIRIAQKKNELNKVS